MGLEVMNNILIDKKEIVVENKVLRLEVIHDYLKITCKGKNKIFLENRSNINLELILEDNSSLELLVKNEKKCCKTNILIIQNNNSNFLYKDAFTSNDDTFLNIKNVLVGNNNKSEIKIRCISNKDNINIDILADVYKNTSDNVIIEDIKGINNGGNINILPNMEINTFEVVANHFVTIGNIRESDLFYLKSKGIAEFVAKELILSGFLKSIFGGEEINE